MSWIFRRCETLSAPEQSRLKALLRLQRKVDRTFGALSPTNDKKAEARAVDLLLRINDAIDAILLLKRPCARSRDRVCRPGIDCCGATRVHMLRLQQGAQTPSG